MIAGCPQGKRQDGTHHFSFAYKPGTYVSGLVARPWAGSNR